MAVVTFDRNELEELVGKKLSEKVLKDRVPMMGCDLERIDEEEVDYEIFPDRPDLLSIEGFARALRYFLGESEGLEKYKPFETDVELKVDRSVKKVRPFIGAGVIRNLEMTEGLLKSLMQVQEKIHTTFGRKRKKVAIGIHDMSEIEPPFTYRAAKPEEIEFVPLGSEEKMNLRGIGEKHPKGKYVDIVKESKKWPVILDKNGQVLSFPPVINGKLTQITEDTKKVFLDVTGTDEEAVNKALNMIATELAERGGEIGIVSVGGEMKPDLEPEEMEVNLDYVNKLLDSDFTEDEFSELVRGMGFGYEKGFVLVPPYRVDVMHPIDIVEDVAIRFGYENFEARIPDVPGIGRPDGTEEFSDRVKELMAGFSFQEVITPVLTNRKKLFGRMERAEEAVVEAENGLSEKYSCAREYLLPGVLEVLVQNKHRSYPQKIFEVGDAVEIDSGSETGARNVRKLACAVSDGTINYTDMASVAVSLLEILGVEFELKEEKSSFCLESRCARIKSGGEGLGIIGEVHPKVLENWNLEKPVAALEINLDKLKEILE